MNRVLFSILIVLCSITVNAQSKFIERSTDVLSVVPSATGLAVAIINHDKKGILQLGLSSATTLGINYALEACIKKDRPDGTGHHAFPSTHTAVAFDGASFLMRRYGWQWGIPAYAVATYVAWGRVHAKRHDWWDVLGGAAIGAGSAFVYTRPFIKNMDVTISPSSFGNEGYGLTASLQF